MVVWKGEEKLAASTVGELRHVSGEWAEAAADKGKKGSGKKKERQEEEGKKGKKERKRKGKKEEKKEIGFF